MNFRWGSQHSQHFQNAHTLKQKWSIVPLIFHWLLLEVHVCTYHIYNTNEAYYIAIDSKCSYTEMEMMFFDQMFHHWLQQKLTKWQLAKQPLMKISSTYLLQTRWSEYINVHSIPFFHCAGQSLKLILSYNSFVRMVQFIISLWETFLFKDIFKTINMLRIVQDSCSSIANALELLQYCTKPLMYTSPEWLMTQFPDTYICISGWTSVNQCAGSRRSGPSDMKPVNPGNCQQPVTEWGGFQGHFERTCYIIYLAYFTDIVYWKCCCLHRWSWMGT